MQRSRQIILATYTPGTDSFVSRLGDHETECRRSALYVSASPNAFRPRTLAFKLRRGGTALSSSSAGCCMCCVDARPPFQCYIWTVECIPPRCPSPRCPWDQSRLESRSGCGLNLDWWANLLPCSSLPCHLLFPSTICCFESEPSSIEHFAKTSRLAVDLLRCPQEGRPHLSFADCLGEESQSDST